MPIAKIELPDGRIARFEVPDGTTPEQVTAFAEKQFSAKSPAPDTAPSKPFDQFDNQANPFDQFDAPEKKGRGIVDDIKQGAGNLFAGAVRGAGSIGATILAPIDAAARAVGVQNDFIGRTDRRQAMDDGLRTMGADPDSLLYQGGKLGAEIAGTAGAGGVIANGVRAVAPAATGLANAIATGGMRAGAMPGVGNMLTRIAGGGITGTAAAGMIDPENAAVGGAIGAALPPALSVAGAAGRVVGRTIRGPDVAPEVLAAAQQARQAGYVMPPTQVRPSLGNRLAEGFAGKLTTAQNASARNQTVTNRLAAQTIGLPGDVPLTRDAINIVRRDAGQAYDAVANAGVITPGPAYTQALDRIVAPYQTAAQGFPNAAQSPVINAINSLRSQSFDASAAVAQLRNVREMADTAFAQGDRGVGRSLREGAEALESAIEEHLHQAGQPQLLQEFQNARRLIAQTYNLEKALNPVTGTVDARKLAAQVAKGRPMTGPMREAAEFAARFPKAAQPVEGMGSLPQTSPLDWGAMGVGSAVTGNPLMMAGVLARPAARSLVLSDAVQNRLATQPGAQNRLMELLANPSAEQLLYRTAPALSDQ